VGTTFDEALRRALDRDAGLLGGRHAVERRYLGRYIPGQRIYAEEVRPRERADVVVVSEEPAAPALARVGGRVLSPRAGRPAR
jgi:uridine kinase